MDLTSFRRGSFWRAMPLRLKLASIRMTRRRRRPSLVTWLIQRQGHLVLPTGIAPPSYVGISPSARLRIARNRGARDMKMVSRLLQAIKH